MSDNPSRCSIGFDLLDHTPTLNELLEHFDKLNKWEEFALHLSRLTGSFLAETSKKDDAKFCQKKEFFQKWIHLHNRNASWRHVLIAMYQAKLEENIVNDVIATKPLNPKKISMTNKDDVTCKVDELQASFIKLVTSMKSLIKCEFMSLLRLTHEYLSMEANFQCSNIDEFFTEIQPYCNFLHIDILEHLIEKLGIEHTEFIKELKKHINELQLFYQSTQLQHLVNILPLSNISSKSILTLKLSSIWNLLSLHNLMIAITYCFGFNKLYFLNIKNDDHNNIQVMFLVLNQSHLSLLLSLVHKTSDRLYQLGIISVNEESYICTEESESVPNLEQSCFKAVKHGDSLLVLALLELGVSVNCVNEHGQTLLMVAIYHEQLQIMHILLSAGSSVDIPDANDNTALMIACEMNRIKIVNILFKFRKPSLDLKNKKGLTAFMIASACEHSLIVGILLQHGANPKLATDSSSIEPCSIDTSLSTTQAQTATVKEKSFSKSELELIQMFEILMKERSLNVSSALQDIRDQSIDIGNKFDLFVKYVDYNPDLLEVLRQRKKSYFSPEYVTIKENFANLCDLLAGNISVLCQFCNYLLSEDILPQGVYSDACNHHKSNIDRASITFNSILSFLKLDLIDPNVIFTKVIALLKKVGLPTMANRLVERLRANGGFYTEQPEVERDLRCCPIELSSKDEVATNIEQLHREFVVLENEIRHSFEVLIEKERVCPNALMRQAARYLNLPKFTKTKDVDEIFNTICSHYDFFNFDILKHLVFTFASSEKLLVTKFEQYVKNVGEFSEISLLKHIRTVISDRLTPLLNDHDPNNANTVNVVIKLNERWEFTTRRNLNIVLEHYFGPESKLMHHIQLSYGCLCVEFLLPKNTYSKNLAEKLALKTDAMYHIGLFKLDVDRQNVLDKEDIIDFKQIHTSAVSGNVFELSILLKLGAYVDTKDEAGKTPLILAVETNQSTEMAETLLAAGANPSITDNEGNTAFMIASNKGFAEKMMISACENGHHLVVRFLLKGHLNINEIKSNNSSLLILASEHGHHHIVQLLIEAKIDCNFQKEDGKTALISATERGHYNAVNILVHQREVNLDIQDKNGYTAIHHACQNGLTELVSLLCEKSAATYFITNTGFTPLMLAGQYGHVLIVKYLITHTTISAYEGTKTFLLTDSCQVGQTIANEFFASFPNDKAITLKQLKGHAKRYITKCDGYENEGRVNWYKEWVWLISPSPRQCQQVIFQLTPNHKTIILDRASRDMIYFMLAPILHKPTVKILKIWSTPLSQHYKDELNCKLTQTSKELHFDSCITLEDINSSTSGKWTVLNDDML